MGNSLLTTCFIAFSTLIGHGQATQITNSADHTAHHRHWQSNQPEAPTPSQTPTPPTNTPPVVATPSPTPTPAPQTPAPITQAPAEIASEQTCPGQSSVASTVSALTCMTSNARVFHGLAPVSSNDALMAAATAKSNDMLTCGYGHEACGHAFNYQMTANGYTGKCTAENIAMGQQSPREVFVAWMNSPGHRANILNAQYNAIGVAELDSPQGPLWTMELGGC